MDGAVNRSGVKFIPTSGSDALVAYLDDFDFMGLTIPQIFAKKMEVWTDIGRLASSHILKVSGSWKTRLAVAAPILERHTIAYDWKDYTQR